MTKGKSKRAVAPNVHVKTAIGTAALLASGASAKGLRESGAGDEEAVVASFDIASKQALNDDPPPNLTVVEKVIAETAPFQMVHQMRSMEVDERAKAADEMVGEETVERLMKADEEIDDEAPAKKAKKEKKEKKSKKEKKKKSKKRKLRQLGMEPPEEDETGSSLSESEQRAETEARFLKEDKKDKKEKKEKDKKKKKDK